MTSHNEVTHMNALTIHTAYEMLGKAAPVAVKTQRVRVRQSFKRDGSAMYAIDTLNDTWHGPKWFRLGICLDAKKAAEWIGYALAGELRGSIPCEA
jgi:hypothetical protein